MDMSLLASALGSHLGVTVKYVRVMELSYDVDTGVKTEYTITHTFNDILVFPVKAEEQARQQGVESTLRTAGFITAHEAVIVLPKRTIEDSWNRCNNKFVLTLDNQQHEIHVVYVDNRPAIQIGNYTPITLDVTRRDYFIINNRRMIISDLTMMPDGSAYVITVRNAT